MRRGENPELTTREKHTRECFVVAKEGADKAAIEEAFGEVGGAAWLVEQAKEKPEVFAGLLGKIIPKEVTVNLNANLAAMSEEEKMALAVVWVKQMGI